VRVLVTGAFGYLGLALLRGLEGYEVVALGRRPRNERALTTVPPWVTTVFGDVLGDAEAVVSGRGPFDAVIHLAGGGGPKKVESDPAAAVRDNALGTALLADVARRGKVQRLLLASTIAVYGTFRPPPGRPYRETDPAAPDDLYGSLKRSAEAIWTGAGLAGGTALRIANIYGAGAGVDLGIAGAVERFARAAGRGGEISIFGTGQQRIDYVHIDDVVRALRLGLERAGLPAVINIGGGEPVAIATLAETCASIGQRRGAAVSLLRKPDPGGKIWPDRALAIERASEVLGWQPRVPLVQGLEEMAEMMARTAGEELT
jgi:UDP-glucose 4-epimerase